MSQQAAQETSSGPSSAEVPLPAETATPVEAPPSPGPGTQNEGGFPATTPRTITRSGGMRMHCDPETNEMYITYFRSSADNQSIIEEAPVRYRPPTNNNDRSLFIFPQGPQGPQGNPRRLQPFHITVSNTINGVRMPTYETTSYV